MYVLWTSLFPSVVTIPPPLRSPHWRLHAVEFIYEAADKPGGTRDDEDNTTTSDFEAAPTLVTAARGDSRSTPLHRAEEQQV